jgi:hypothetical protein
MVTRLEIKAELHHCGLCGLVRQSCIAVCPTHQKARSDLVIPQLQPGDNVNPQLVNIIQIVKGWDAFSTFISPKISRF